LISFSFCIRNENHTYDQALENYFKLENFNHIAIIPNEGCSGCISDATNAVKKNIDDLPYLGVLFIKVEDEKLLKLKIGEQFLNYNRVQIDQEKLFSKVELNTLYPLLIKIKKEKVVKVETFDKKKLSLIPRKVATPASNCRVTCCSNEKGDAPGQETLN